MVKITEQTHPTRRAIVSLYKSNLSPDKVEVKLTIEVTEVKTITQTLKKEEINSFLTEHGLAPIELDSLGSNGDRQVMQVFDMS
jgi:hypothetical protein